MSGFNEVNFKLNPIAVGDGTVSFRTVECMISLACENGVFEQQIRKEL